MNSSPGRWLKLSFRHPKSPSNLLVLRICLQVIALSYSCWIRGHFETQRFGLGIPKRRCWFWISAFAGVFSSSPGIWAGGKLVFLSFLLGTEWCQQGTFLCLRRWRWALASLENVRAGLEASEACVCFGRRRTAEPVQCIGAGKLCEPDGNKFSVGCSLVWENRPVQVIQSWGFRSRRAQGGQFAVWGWRKACLQTAALGGSVPEVAHND